MTTPVILASASLARRELLTNAGVSFEVEPARIDETEIKAALVAEQISPREIADALAELKALRVSARHPGALVIGSDQVLSLGGDIFDKPGDPYRLARQLDQLRGKRHDLISAAVIAQNGNPIWRAVSVAHLTMRQFSDSFRDSYVAQHGEDCLSCVGGYQIERAGAALFARVEGDVFTIMGLPLLELLAFLRIRGVIAE